LRRDGRPQNPKRRAAVEPARRDHSGLVELLAVGTIPLLGHTLTLVSIMIVLHGLAVFTIVAVMLDTGGGPGRAAYTLNLLVFEEALGRLNYGLATAIAFALFPIVLIITIIQFRLLKPTWSY